MAALHRSYHLEKDVHFVSFSVNPEQDTPAVLADYAKKFSADTHQWHFLTGTRAALTDIAVHSFKLGSIEEPIFHSADFVLIDRKGQMRGYYDGTDPKNIQLLFKAIAALLKEKNT